MDIIDKDSSNNDRSVGRPEASDGHCDAVNLSGTID